jgi:hypothetical protein
MTKPKWPLAEKSAGAEMTNRTAIAWFNFTLMVMLCTGAAQHEAHALADGPACAIVKLGPAFLNFREDFTMSGRIILRLSPGDNLYVMATEAGINTVGDWAEVQGVYRRDGFQGDENKPLWRHGWVARRFIREIKCPKEMQR